MKKFISSIILLLLVVLSACTKSTKENKITGPYIGQKLPGTTPEMFAPGIVSTGLTERDFAISPDGKEIYFSVSCNRAKYVIAFVKQINGVWTKPKIASFSGKYNDLEPYIQPDGKKLFFVSKRPLVEGKKNKDNDNMWYMNKTETGWDDPKPVGEPINGHGSVFYPSITKTGTMYFTRRNEEGEYREYIFRSKFVDGKYSEPEKLPENINWSNAQYNTFTSPNEDYIIVPVNNPKAGDQERYHVSFRDENDNWSKLIDLGDIINNGGGGWTPSLSHDAKYFFFQRHIPRNVIREKYKDTKFTYSDIVKMHNSPDNGNSDIYWVDAKVITDLNPFVK